jgi:hypothetical protein
MAVNAPQGGFTSATLQLASRGAGSQVSTGGRSWVSIEGRGPSAYPNPYGLVVGVHTGAGVRVEVGRMVLTWELMGVLPLTA